MESTVRVGDDSREPMSKRKRRVASHPDTLDSARTIDQHRPSYRAPLALLRPLARDNESSDTESSISRKRSKRFRKQSHHHRGQQHDSEGFIQDDVTVTGGGKRASIKRSSSATLRERQLRTGPKQTRDRLSYATAPASPRQLKQEDDSGYTHRSLFMTLEALRQHHLANLKEDEDRDEDEDPRTRQKRLTRWTGDVGTKFTMAEDLWRYDPDDDPVSQKILDLYTRLSRESIKVRDELYTLENLKGITRAIFLHMTILQKRLRIMGEIWSTRTKKAGFQVLAESMKRAIAEMQRYAGVYQSTLGINEISVANIDEHDVA